MIKDSNFINLSGSVSIVLCYPICDQMKKILARRVEDTQLAHGHLDHLITAFDKKRQFLLLCFVGHVQMRFKMNMINKLVNILEETT